MQKSNFSIAGPEKEIPEGNGIPFNGTQILNTLIAPPLQKEALAIKGKVDPTSLESAEAILDEEVSTPALSYAMALQEKESYPLSTVPMAPDQKAEGEFSALSSAVKESPQKPLLDQAPQEATGLPRESAQPTEAEINAEGKSNLTAVAAKTAPSTGKQAPPQEIKTKDSLVSSASKGAEKESVTPLGHTSENARDHSKDNGNDLDLEQSTTEAAKKAKKSDLISLASEKAFSASLSKSTPHTATSSNAQAGLTFLQSGDLESFEGRDIEEAVHRGNAQTEGKTTSSQGLHQSAQQSTHQSSLAHNASLQEQIAFSIKNNAPKGKSEISLQLRPDSLGRLNIKIDINKEGQTFVVVTAERTETRDLLQQDSRQLMELLEQSDLEINDENMSYSLFNDQERKDFEKKEGNAFESGQAQTSESSVIEKADPPLIPLGMREVQVPRHGGTWQAIA